MLAGVIAWTLCALLLALTVACQRPKRAWLRRLKYRDVAAVVPAWTFFAPNPGVTDTRVLWRECLVDGGVSPWRELLPPVGGLVRAVWNPRKREAKLLTDAGQMILRMAVQHPDSSLTLISVPYLLLLNHVTRLPASPLVAARQFLVVQTQHAGTEDGDLRPLFASRWHALVAPGGARDGSPHGPVPGARRAVDGPTTERPRAAPQVA